jgi:hypothetical protein
MAFTMLRVVWSALDLEALFIGAFSYSILLFMPGVR